MRSLVTASVRTVINSRDPAQYVPGGMVRKAREHPQVSGAHRGPRRYLVTHHHFSSDGSVAILQNPEPPKDRRTSG